MVAAEEAGDARSPGPGLRVEVRRGGEWDIVSFAGDLDLAGHEAAEHAVGRALARDGTGIVLDLSALEFCGSEGIRLVLTTRERAAGAGRRVKVVAGTGPARRLIDLLGLGSELGVEDVRR